MSNYEKGSEWRKWDLHIHTPETKLNNNYGNDWDKFISQINESDITVFGITDYFSIDNYNAFLNKFNTKHPDSRKVFFPNIEFRLESKNNSNDHIQCHVIFSNELEIVSMIPNFLTRLPLISTDDATLTNKHCTNDDLLEVTYKKAMISIDKLIEKLSENFSNDKYIIAGVANGYGSLRPGNNDGRGAEYAKELDKKFHAFFGIETNVDFYLNKMAGRGKSNLPPKPILNGSDCHSFEDINKKLGKTFVWVKADPVFEGLRQILCEPDSRIKIQENKPDEKTGYQVIDSIDIDNENIKQTIQFNTNLNTIIGGRSTGKSTLLQLLALKIDSSVEAKNKEFIESIVSDVNVKWKDGEINKERDIEFFPQSHMHDIARKQDKKDELVKRIIQNTHEQQKIDAYYKFCITNKEEIQGAIDNLFKLQNDINNKNIFLKEMGDKNGLELEIENITTTITTIDKNNNFSNDDAEKFEEINKYIVESGQYIKVLNKDKTHILSLKDESLFNHSISYKFNELSDDSKLKIDAIFTNLSKNTIKIWGNELDKALTDINIEIEKYQQQNNIQKQQPIFKKGQQYIAENKQYSELNERLRIEQKKLQKIVIIEKQIESLLVQKNTQFDYIVKKHITYLDEVIKLEQGFILKHESIKIQIQQQFLEKKCKGLLEDFINLQSRQRKEFVDEFSDNYKNNLEETIKDFLQNALDNKIGLKAYKDIKDLTKGLLVENWFSLSYEITYQNDSFTKMSDGKKAFVILKLLLDFSEKKCPILIDQPEDSLDNRAIYNELVVYIKQKKTQRQIILVTHNANVVVNADAEEVIVANQHGKDSKNQNDIKFQYISGSLENTQPNNDTQNIVLNSQGIKEHVCEILEGGVEAFKRREGKYGIRVIKGQKIK